MRPPSYSNSAKQAYSLVEMLAAMAIMAILAVILVAMVGNVQRAWISSGNRAEIHQNGRAILDMISRELGSAVIAKDLQFVQNPTLPAITNGATQVPHSDSLFWQAPLAGNEFGNLCEVGYFLTRNTTVAPSQFRLQRFYVPPENPTLTGDEHKYRIFDSRTTFGGSYSAANMRWFPPDAAPWLSMLTPNQFTSSLSALSDGVLGFWVRLLDSNGDPIPWLKNADSYSSADPLKFNSAAGFIPAVPGEPDSFCYTDMTTTLAANRLPASAEITLITLDSRTMNRADIQTKLQTLALPQPTNPAGVPAAIRQFNDSLIANGITSAQLFTTTVSLINGAP